MVAIIPSLDLVIVRMGLKEDPLILMDFERSDFEVEVWECFFIKMS
jgi:hypothetical protein